MPSRAWLRVKSITIRTLPLGVLVVAGLAAPVIAQPEEDLIQLYSQDKVYVAVPENLFNQLGWDLPDGGRSVKALGDAAPQGAFDPRKLETIPASQLGYQPKWHEVRFKVYGLDWYIGGLHLTPNNPVAGLPTLVIVHGGSANWYEFFVDQFNNPGLGQYLAQKVPVLLLTAVLNLTMPCNGAGVPGEKHISILLSDHTGYR